MTEKRKVEFGIMSPLRREFSLQRLLTMGLVPATAPAMEMPANAPREYAYV